jgi:hypothetical protein
MSDITSPVGIGLTNDYQNVFILTPIPATSLTSTDSIETASSIIDNIPKTVREKFMLI